ncbi:aminomethyltransferase family protein [Clostridium felsineum]|uniref:aminomethyltransferase family protein n=1 Tax=Clostridium felsineum TaxID=36839 RepID=UPI00098C2D5B|nr:aminomethyltransferase family protein [Clostridium felsineum]MCR3759398.1 aminomethyltransferase family protein [Clostridium felsineum]URZ01691.1 Aminomethyltransferase [Clostridium felsineum]
MKESILKSVYGQDVKLMEVCGYEVAEAFSDYKSEYEAIRKNIGLVDYSNFGIFKVSGEDAKDFIQKLTTRDFEYLAPEKARTALVLDEDANVISLVHVFNLETYYYVLTDIQHIEKTNSWFTKHIFGDVSVELLTGKISAISIEGPKSWQIAQNFLPYDISAFAFMNAIEVTYENQKIVLSRFGFTGEYGYFFFAPAEISKNLWNKILELGTDKGIIPCGMSVISSCMLEVRQPDINTEIVEGSNLFETRLQWLIDFTKEEYIGHDAIMKMMDESPKSGVVGFSVSLDAKVEKGDSVYVDEDVIGKIICTYESCSLNKKLGLVLLENKFVAVGLVLDVRGKSGETAQIDTLSSPYIIPESWLIKMV